MFHQDQRSSKLLIIHLAPHWHNWPNWPVWSSISCQHLANSGDQQVVVVDPVPFALASFVGFLVFNPDFFWLSLSLGRSIIIHQPIVVIVDGHSPQPGPVISAVQVTQHPRLPHLESTLADSEGIELQPILLLHGSPMGLRVEVNSDMGRIQPSSTVAQLQ